MLGRTLAPLFLASVCLGLAAKDEPKKEPDKVVAPKAAPDPSALKPFADIVKEAEEIKGLFPLWRKGEKVWLELATDQLEKPYFFTVNTVQSVGERGLYGGMMGDSHVVVFRRIGNNLQLLAKNTAFLAKEGSPLQRAVAEGFSDSLIANVPVLCQPHPERKTILVEANALLLRDIPMGALQLEAAYRQPYGFDAGNSAFLDLTNTPELTGLHVNAHYALAKLMLPPPAMPGMPPMPFTPLPETLEDVRSLFMGFYYNLTRLPETPMVPRRADDRVGHFVTTRWDWTSDAQLDPRQRLVNRWRLEKADPAAPLSKPKEPIVYWLDRNIPEEYRDTVKAGILEWNKAFEKLGFQDAIEVRQQPDDAAWSTHDARHASVRWFLGTDAGFAIGPSVVDPRTGEILDADIAVSDAFTRGGQEEFREEIPPTGRNAARACTYLAESAQEAGFAQALLEARGDLEPGSPEAAAFARSYLKDIIMHEVGHTLGLRHNFRASTTYTPAQLSDPAFTKVNGITGSVMDYTPTNIAPKGRTQADYHMPTLGPYDYWAIEYAYRPLDPAREKEELARIAARGETTPVLAYGTDEEADGFDGSRGMDPEVNRWDLGNDPLHFLDTRIQLSREFLDRLQARQFKPGEDYLKLRRGVNIALNRVAVASQNAAKYLGGVVYLRDHAGSGRAPFAPVSGARQREALKLLETGIFDMNAFRFKPDFLARLTVNQFDRFQYGGNPDFSVTASFLRIQKALLNEVMEPAVMRRILDGPDKLDDPKAAFRLSELFDGLQGAIWAELKTAKEPTGIRRGLQKEHLRHLARLVLQAGGVTPDDARALAREALKALQGQLKTAGGRPGFSKEAKAHFAECLATIDETLKAPVLRNTF